jgi:hypothetical protein
MDDGGNNVNIFNEFGVAVLFHEFIALPELHLQDLGQIFFLFQEEEVMAGEDVQFFAGVVFLFKQEFDLQDDLADFIFEQRDQDVVLVVEIEVDGAVRDLGLLGDIGDAGIEKAFFGKDLDRRLGDFAMFV